MTRDDTMNSRKRIINRLVHGIFLCGTILVGVTLAIFLKNAQDIESQEVADLNSKSSVSSAQAPVSNDSSSSWHGNSSASSYWQNNKDGSKTLTITDGSTTIKGSWKNKYGTPDTICAHQGCKKYIAPSGDTNCCKTHSKRCAICGDYIDEDAFVCIDCTADALNNMD